MLKKFYQKGLFIYPINDDPVIKLNTHPVNQRANIKGIIMLIIKSRIAKTKTSEKGNIKRIEMKGWLSINVLTLFIS